jgi:hypothetical protein
MGEGESGKNKKEVVDVGYVIYKGPVVKDMKVGVWEKG